MLRGVVARKGAGVPALRVELLGGFRVVVDGRTVPHASWRLRRARDLVAILALSRGHRLHREEAMSLLWPEDGGATRANDLHQVLHVARRALDASDPSRFLQLRGDLLLLAVDGTVEVDVADAEAAVRRARDEPSIEAWTGALEAVTAELLPESRYQDWAAAHRREVEELEEEALTALLAAHQARGDASAVAPLRRRLRDRAGVQSSGEIEGDARPSPSPPVLGGTAGRHNLPLPMNSFVGRTRQLAELTETVGRSRLLTLSGPGGAGKTRLACELGLRILDRYPEGVWFTDLGAISDGSLVLTAVVEALGVRPRPGDSMLATVTGHLRGATTLLLLDNCEHVIEACAEYAETLLRDCPGLTILATSREPLRVGGEIVWRTPSLQLPADTAATGTLQEIEAVRLLVDRATAVDPGFAVDGSNASDVVHLCRRLDGLPLALELAAARLGALTPGQLVDRLDERFRLLTAGSRTALTRQQTLAATLDWSHDLLSLSERAVLRRLSVFAGGFELAAAERVCAGDPVPIEEVAAVVAGLAEKSLVAVETGDGGGRRHRLLETIRQYGRGHLHGAGEATATAHRHAEWFLHLAELSQGAGARQDEPSWLRRLDLEVDNLRAALGWALEAEPELGARLAAALGPFWLRLLRLAEGSGWLNAAIDAHREEDGLRLRLLMARSAIEVRRLGQTPEQFLRMEEAVRISHAAGDPEREASALLLLGSERMLRRVSTGGTSDFGNALKLARDRGLPHLEAAAHGCLAVVDALLGRLDEAEIHFQDAARILEALAPAEHAGTVLIPGFINIGEVIAPRPETGGRVRCVLEETVVLLRELDAEEALVHIGANSGVLARLSGDLDLAGRRLAAAEERARRRGDLRGVADALARRGNLALSGGHPGAARDLFQSALELRTQTGDARSVGLTIASLGRAALAAGDAAEARELVERAHGLFARAGDRPGLTSAACILGDVHLVAGDLAAAESHYLTLPEGIERYGGWMDYCLSDVAEARGDLPLALALMRAARTAIAAVYGPAAAAVCDVRLAVLEG